MDYVQFISGWEFSWFKMSEEVNSCEMHLVPLLVTTCHHMSHKDVNFQQNNVAILTQLTE